ncbi:unnamed protein product [Somion occarium]|uniref:Uncharacterized protein n=1 Tax=Somion occarium TaxID=3059160 RepID=A0ABP1DIK2_9APHY
MQLTIGPPLLFALGIRILLNFLNPEHTQSTADELLQGLWQGVLLYHTLIHLSELVFVVAIAIVGFTLFEVLRNGFDATKCACTLLGVAVGVLITSVLSQVIEDTSHSDVSSKDKKPSNSGHANTIPVNDPISRRTRLVSFGRSSADRHRQVHMHRHTREREPDQRPRHSHTTQPRPAHTPHQHPHPHPHRPPSGYDPALRDLTSPTPTLAYSVDTAPSISIDSVSSSIDPKGLLSPREREVAILRARASLADSERRRFKEERKWALSMGNKARANQLAWQVKRYAALMESYHREADAKVVEAARVAVPHQQSHPQQRQQPFPSTLPSNGQSTQRRGVTVGATSAGRVRKRSGGHGGGPPVTLKPAMYVPGRETITVKR